MERLIVIIPDRIEHILRIVLKQNRITGLPEAARQPRARIKRKGINNAVHLTVQDIFQCAGFFLRIIIRDGNDETVSPFFRIRHQSVRHTSLHTVVK